MLGYCALGRVVMETTPTTMMTIAMTHAKTGRSMKNLDIVIFLSFDGAQCSMEAVAGRSGAAKTTIVVVGEPCDAAFVAHLVDDILLPLLRRT